MPSLVKIFFQKLIYFGNFNGQVTDNKQRNGTDGIVNHHRYFHTMLALPKPFLKDYEVYFISKGNSPGTISTYMRGIRAIYNKAIEEDDFKPLSNPFTKYKIPRSKNTKKPATSKNNFLEIRKLNYPKDSILWHTKNYILIMFNCRGMNLIDLVKLKVENIKRDRLNYGRSKTGDSLSVKITPELFNILSIYISDKESEDYLFPINYDGSTEHYEKYKSIRRRVNERLKIIAKDAGIEEKFTTYTIRHS